jgi:hypothetical protein
MNHPRNVGLLGEELRATNSLNVTRTVVRPYYVILPPRHIIARDQCVGTMFLTGSQRTIFSCWPSTSFELSSPLGIVYVLDTPVVDCCAHVYNEKAHGGYALVSQRVATTRQPWIDIFFSERRCVQAVPCLRDGW